MQNDIWVLGAVLTLLLLATAFVLAKRHSPESSIEEKSEETPAEEVAEVQAEPAPEPQSEPEPVQEKEVESKTLDQALSKTRSGFIGRIKGLFSGDGSLSELDDLEEILYTSDLGPQTVQRLMDGLDEKLSKNEKKDFETVRSALRDEMTSIFSEFAEDDPFDSWTQPRNGEEPTVLMIVGVNGAGKTTTIGKLSRRFSENGKKVLIAAGDTFRAAAEDQLRVWSERAEVEIFSPEDVKDPSAVAYDACEKARADKHEALIVDTAGRLHTQKNLMEELKKMKRVIAKVFPDAPHEILLVLDANSGQNALLQAKNFHEALGVTGVILTKMDGTAKGGVAVGVACELKLPIRLIGVGEGLHDLRPFSSKEFVDSIV